MTVRKCRGFARRWEFNALDLVNLFALVSTDPRGLLASDDPIGPVNDHYIASVLSKASLVVWAWGDVPTPQLRRLLTRRLEDVTADRPLFLTHLVPSACEVRTLGRTKSGQPRHPSRLAYSTALEAP
jgi:hypothetical protein